MEEEETQKLEWQDYLVIAAYFIAVIIVGIWSSCRNRGSIGGYFLAGRSMHWIPVGASLFASNIGSGHFVGLAGSGAASGIGVAVFELNAIFVLMFLGWVFVPVYTAAGVFTMPEYLKKRFGGQRIRIYLSCLALLLYIFTKISADLYSGALFIELSTDLDLYIAICIILAIAALFTVAGGLTAVIWTDFIQTVIMVVGAFILMVMSFVKVGGYGAMVKKYFEAWPNTTHAHYGDSNYSYTSCGIPPPDSMNFFRPVKDGNYPWTGMMFGLTISSIWYWCSDQVIVQRALAAKNITNAKAGCVFAGVLKFLPMWLIVFPGMIARIMFPNKVACADPEICMNVCRSKGGCTNIAFPTLVLEIMPPGLRGLMMAVMMSALVSSLTSIFNSSSTIFTMDIWRRIHKSAGEVELMIVGRLCVLVLVGVGIAWIPIVQNVSELFHYIQAITSFLAPPVCAVYLLAVLWKRINEKGAFWGLMSGLAVGLTRFIWEYVYTVPPCGEGENDDRPAIIKDVHYLHFGILLFGIVAIVTIAVSLLTKQIDDCHLYRLTFWSRYSTEERIELTADDEIKTEIRGDDEDAPCYKVACNWICGIEKVGKESNISDEQRMAEEKKKLSIYESPGMRRAVNFAAIILMVGTTFFWGFYA